MVIAQNLAQWFALQTPSTATCFAVGGLASVGGAEFCPFPLIWGDTVACDWEVTGSTAVLASASVAKQYNLVPA